MTNENIKKMLTDGYNELAFTDKYILVYTFNKTVYFTITDNKIVDTVLKLDKASRGAGYSLRFKPNKQQKILLMSLGATALCSLEYFNTLVCESIYNRGEIAEKLVTEFFNQEWEKDNIPFTEAGDIIVNDTHYQIKFEKATFINEKTLIRLRATLAL